MTDYSADRVRGFPAFGPQRRGARFARSWWGNAWIEALEHTSLDRGRLSRGRTYARTGHVGSITISPGRIAAPVHGSADEPYATSVTVEQLDDRHWDRFLDHVAGTAGHIAALLDHDMPHDLVQSAEDVGVPLLPGVGDLDPECTCLDWGHPCKHAAALCYQVSWLLDVNPFLLLLTRGRSEPEILDELQRRTSAPAAESPAASTDPTAATVPAAKVFATVPAALPDLPAPPTAPAPPLVLPPPTIADATVDVAALSFLAADAAHRAAALLAAPPPDPASSAQPPYPFRPLDEWQDTVRIAATYRDERVLTRLAESTERRDALVRAATAWAYGGAAGLDTLEHSWSPAPTDLTRAWASVTSSWGDDELPQIRTWRNRWTVTDTGKQLRYGRDTRWYPYHRQADEWWPAGPPSRDPTALLADLLGQ